MGSPFLVFLIVITALTPVLEILGRVFGCHVAQSKAEIEPGLDLFGLHTPVVEQEVLCVLDLRQAHSKTWVSVSEDDK